jgi:ubiquinone/menaquinone biosynthesis C-methylase UbiE
MIDVLTSATLKYLREHWWDDAFTDFLIDTLRPRPGNRILDVGCGTGMAEIRIGRLHLSQLRLFGVDLRFDRVAVARHDTAAHNQRVSFAAADAAALPFPSNVFDSTYGVAVLQHVADLTGAVREMTRVTRPGGRIVTVEPDNAARYWHSSEASGVEAYAARNRFFAAMHAVAAAPPENAVGPRLDYRKALDTYERAARAAGAGFVEIQHATVFATVGQKGE